MIVPVLLFIVVSVPFFGSERIFAIEAWDLLDSVKKMRFLMRLYRRKLNKTSFDENLTLKQEKKFQVSGLHSLDLSISWKVAIFG